MNKRIFLAVILAITLIFSLLGCGSESMDPVTTEPAAEDPQGTSPTPNSPTVDNSSSTDSANTDGFVFADCWNYNEGDYPPPNKDAQKYWEEFKQLKSSGASYNELCSVLSEVVAYDDQFIPGYVEYARYILLNYYTDASNDSPSNAMNILTSGYYYTGEPLLMELKESLGWNEFSKIIDQANAALKEGNRAVAWETILSLPEEYSGIWEADRIVYILNNFDDAYYYLTLGTALGNHYIVHFRIDGTYERVKMNEDGIYDTGTWDSNKLAGYDISFAGLMFHARGGGEFYWNELDSNGNTREYEMRLSEDGAAQEQFAYIASLEQEVTGIIAILTANKWQVDEGWYYQFYDDGTGIVSMEDNSYSYGFTYIEHPEMENTISITPSDIPDPYNWIYDPDTGTFLQESYGYDVETDSGVVFYMDVFVYNG